MHWVDWAAESSVLRLHFLLNLLRARAPLPHCAHHFRSRIPSPPRRFETQARHFKRTKETINTFGGGEGGGVSAEDLEKEGQKAFGHLEDIATYMIDYSSIVKEWEADVMGKDGPI